MMVYILLLILCQLHMELNTQKRDDLKAYLINILTTSSRNIEESENMNSLILIEKCINYIETISY